MVIPCRGTEDRNGTGINSGKSGMRNLELGVSEAEPRVKEARRNSSFSSHAAYISGLTYCRVFSNAACS